MQLFIQIVWRIDNKPKYVFVPYLTSKTARARSGPAQILPTRNITLAFLLGFVLKGGIVFKPISPPTIGIKSVFVCPGSRPGLGNNSIVLPTFLAAIPIYHKHLLSTVSVATTLLSCEVPVLRWISVSGQRTRPNAYRCLFDVIIKL